MSRMKKVTVLLMGLIISATAAFSQEAQKEVSDQELKQFAEAFQKVQVVNEDIQQDMMKTIQDNGLDVQRYNEIQQTQQQPSQETKASSEDLKKFETISVEIDQMRVQAQQKMQNKIEETGLTIPRYQEIAAVVQNSPDLQKKMQEYLQG